MSLNSVKDPDPEATSVLFVGTGLPPFQRSYNVHVAARIQAGEYMYMYVDMAELLPDRSGVSAGPVTKDDKQNSKLAPPSYQHFGMDPMLWYLCMWLS